MTAWLAPVAGSRVIRRAADAGFVRAAHRRALQLDRMDVAAAQERTLLRLVRTAQDTRFGRDHDFARVRGVADYQARVAVWDYERLWNTYWQPTYPRLDGQTWPGFVPYYALSSGTTSGTTKYIPVTREMVRSNHKAAFTTLALFRHAHPKHQTFTGKFFFLGGSTDMRPQEDGSLAGDLSGIAAKGVGPALRPYVFPSLEDGRVSDWEKKLPLLAGKAIHEPITALSGIPSWCLKLFDEMKRRTGKATVSEIWPQLRLVVHGGIKFDPYRDLYRREIGSDRVRFIETYPCSEGFVATEDPRYDLLRLVPDHGVFFEFVPVEELGKDRPTRHTAATVELGVQYAVLLTTCAGVWSYLVGDTVAFERRDPPLLRFTGRTKYFLSAFGEHLISEEVEKGVAAAARAVGVDVVNFHVGPVFPTEPTKPGHHLYLVEFHGPPPADASRFAVVLDAELCRLNEDYAAHRVGDLTMLKPEVRAVAPGRFEAWVAGRVGKDDIIQAKVPRMDNTGTITAELASWVSR
jgi:hypothetical protein